MIHPAPAINLLSKKKLKFDEQLSLSSKVKKGAGIVLVVYAIVLAALVGVNLVVSQQLTETRSAQDQAKNSLLAQTVLVSHYEQIASRVGIIQQLMDARREVVDLWQQLQGLVPEECTLTQFSIKDNTLLVGIKSPHVVLANKMLELIEPALPSLGATKTMASISRSADAGYQLDFELVLNTTRGKE